MYEKLDALNITLPELTPPVAAFVPFLRSGNLLFLSGHIAKNDGKPWVGQVGENLAIEQGKSAARSIGLVPVEKTDARVPKSFSARTRKRVKERSSSRAIARRNYPILHLPRFA
jgi:hypothetical protein